MKTFNEYLCESVLKYKWKAVHTDDVALYVKNNNLKLIRDKDDASLYIAVHKNNPTKVTFRYDIDSMNLYSDYTLIELEDGKAK